MCHIFQIRQEEIADECLYQNDSMEQGNLRIWDMLMWQLMLRFSKGRIGLTIISRYQWHTNSPPTVGFAFFFFQNKFYNNLMVSYYFTSVTSWSLIYKKKKGLVMMLDSNWETAKSRIRSIFDTSDRTIILMSSLLSTVLIE